MKKSPIGCHHHQRQRPNHDPHLPPPRAMATHLTLTRWHGPALPGLHAGQSDHLRGMVAAMKETNMQTDYELLMLAAKAINCTLTLEDGGGGYVVPYLYGEEPGDEIGEWSPLTDDGDALRLAVKLHINIEHTRTFKTMQFKEVAAFPFGRGDCLAFVQILGDPYAATRRSIVCAAAAVGRSMQ